MPPLNRSQSAFSLARCGTFKSLDSRVTEAFSASEVWSLLSISNAACRFFNVCEGAWPLLCHLLGHPQYYSYAQQGVTAERMYCAFE